MIDVDKKISYTRVKDTPYYIYLVQYRMVQCDHYAMYVYSMVSCELPAVWMYDISNRKNFDLYSFHLCFTSLNIPYVIVPPTCTT